MDRLFLSFIFYLACLFVGTLATSNTTQKAQASTSPAPKNPLCDECIVLAKLAKTEITQDKVKHALEALCAKRHGLLKKVCSKILSEEEKFVANFNVNKACHDLLFCSKWSDIIVKIAEDAEAGFKDIEKIIDGIISKIIEALKNILKIGESELCKVCKELVNVTDHAVVPVEDEVIKFADSLCRDLPYPTNNACLEYVNLAIDTWWGDIFESPDKVCTFLKLCKD